MVNVSVTGVLFSVGVCVCDVLICLREWLITALALAHYSARTMPLSTTLLRVEADTERGSRMKAARGPEIKRNVHVNGSVVKRLWGVFVWGFGVLFLSCVCVSGVLFSVGVCV